MQVRIKIVSGFVQITPNEETSTPAGNKCSLLFVGCRNGAKDWLQRYGVAPSSIDEILRAVKFGDEKTAEVEWSTT